MRLFRNGKILKKFFLLSTFWISKCSSSKWARTFGASNPSIWLSKLEIIRLCCSSFWSWSKMPLRQASSSDSSSPEISLNKKIIAKFSDSRSFIRKWSSSSFLFGRFIINVVWLFDWIFSSKEFENSNPKIWLMNWWGSKRVYKCGKRVGIKGDLNKGG